jgi:hypothetical protein
MVILNAAIGLFVYGQDYDWQIGQIETSIILGD